MGSSEKSILKTLLYADIFDFPLTKNEIWQFLISDKKISKNSLFKITSNVYKFIGFKDNLFFIKGKNNLIRLRKKREKISVNKLLKAEEIINKISFVPTVKFIGISGALSMKNSDKNDDIDLFVITKNGFAWITRFMLVLILIILGKYRYKNEKIFSDKICLNMILDENNMVFKKNNKNIYTAHEIAQLIPVFDRSNTYKKFMIKNNWINKYLANYFISKEYIKEEDSLFNNLIIYVFKILFLEKISRFIQIKYMKKNITKEVIQNGFLAFHPFDYGEYVLKNYNQRIKKYKL